MPTECPFISVIVINFNGKEWLRECFESLAKLTYPKDRFEVIMGDNASSDDSVEFVRTSFPWIQIMVFENNYGFCRSNNLCAEEAKGEYVAFLNNDTFVTADWLTNLVKGVQSDPDVICCASKLLFPHLADGKLINAAGGFISPLGGGLYRGWMQSDSPEFAQREFTGFGCAAAVLIQKRFFLDTGGFSEYYFYSIEESDLGLRVWLYGYKVLYNPDAIVYHYMGKTGFGGKGVPPTIEFLTIRNQLYFVLVNFERFNVFKGLALATGKSLLKMIYAALHGQWKTVGAHLRAPIVVMMNMKKIFTARDGIQTARKLRDKQLVDQGILATLSQTFLWHKRTLESIREHGSTTYYQSDDEFKVDVDKNGHQIFVDRT